jgi:hypothetical protein
VIDEDGLVEKLVGDEVVAFWGAGFAANYVRRTVQAAQNLVSAMAAADPSWHRRVFRHGVFRALGTAEGLTDISAKARW